MSNSVIDLICNRVSSPRLEEPAPENDVLQKIYRTALRAPDHKVLRPWRYLVIQGESRVKLGDLFCEAAMEDDSDLSEAQKDKFKSMPLRAPMIIVGISKNVEHPKVPIVEQEVSCGVGMGYMLLSLQSFGFGGIWRTGAMAEHSLVKSRLGIEEHESLIGFLYVGTPVGEPKKIQSVDVSNFFMDW